MRETDSNAAGDESAPLALEDHALATLRANVRAGHDPYYRFRYSYVRPSPGRYTWQWLWDSSFHVAALARLDPDMARQEVRSLLAAQDPDGFIPHMVYWGKWGGLLAAAFAQSPPRMWRRRHSGMIQPPLLAQAVESVYLATGDATFLAETLPRAQAHYDWLSRHRDPDGRGSIVTLSPLEAGVDNSPSYDRALGVRKATRASVWMATRALDLRNIVASRLPAATRGPFALIDVLVNVTYADGLRTLARLWKAAGETDRAKKAAASADAAEAAMHERCWEPRRGLYAHRWLKQDGTEELLDTLTIASILPLILETTPEERLDRLVEGHLKNEGEFWLQFPVPTVAMCEPSFDADCHSLIGRGPVNMGLNWMLVRGLRRRGFGDEADHIAERSRSLAERSGFREHYNPLTGEGLRGDNFGWATTAIAMNG